MRDRHDLCPLRKTLKRLRDPVRGLAADACVDLVEHHRLAASHRRDRKSDSRQLSARGGLGDGGERQACVGPDQERNLVGPGLTEVALTQLGDELAAAHADAGELPRHLRREAWRRLCPRGAQRGRQPTHILVGGGQGFCRRGHRIEPVVDRVQLRLGLEGACKQFLVRVGAEAPFRVGDPVEVGLDLLEPPGLGLERGQERA